LRLIIFVKNFGAEHIISELRISVSRKKKSQTARRLPTSFVITDGRS
jgi:hypothetical protein